jgi:hypothetical protein
MQPEPLNVLTLVNKKSGENKVLCGLALKEDAVKYKLDYLNRLPQNERILYDIKISEVKLWKKL